MGYSFNNIPTQLTIGGTPYGGYFTVDTTATNITLENFVVVDALQGIAPERVLKAFLDLYIPYIVNTHVNDNWMHNTQYIQTKRSGAATWADAIHISDGGMELPGSTAIHYGVLVGTGDIKTGIQNCITYNQQLNIRWEASEAMVDSFLVYNVQPVLRVVLY